MCGICGFSGIGNGDNLHRMMNSMPYRGPDGDGQWHDGGSNYLGHLRLAIVDMEGGTQPLKTEDGSLVVVFNGEIYNHHELREQLESRGHRFKTDHSDTEVLLYGYREWGMDLTRRLNGMWAFALMDQKNGLLWLSRDRFGKKPLYYTQKGETFAFSSELASLATHPIVENSIDRLSLVKYFAYGYVPAPRSMLSRVNKLPAGHDLLFDLRKRVSKVQRYWRLRLEPDEALASKPEELTESLIQRLSSAVEIRLQADVPVGVFLSGGIDSSAVVALAQLANEGVVRSFSIGFEESSFDESSYSHKVSAALGTEHQAETLSATRCLELLDSIYSRLDEPLGDSSLVPSFLMCKLARNQVTVALGGDGSDELFAGYDPFRALTAARFYTQVVPNSAHRTISSLMGKIPVSHRNMSFDFKIKKFLAGLGYGARIQNPVWLGPLPPDYLSKLFGESISIEEVYSEAIDAWNYPETDNDIDRTLQFYTELYLQNNILPKMDRAGMLNSLEVRSPFLDFNFVDLVRQVPARLKFDGKETKKILKESLSPLLPSEILYRKKKGFGIPIGQWFKDGHIEIDSSRFSEILDTEFVKQLKQEHLSNKADWRSFLWAYYGLERWLDQPVFSRALN